MVVGANKKTNTKRSMMAICDQKKNTKERMMVVIMN